MVKHTKKAGKCAPTLVYIIATENSRDNLADGFVTKTF